jgi:hypothetical protein
MQCHSDLTLGSVSNGMLSSKYGRHKIFKQH